MSDDDRSRWMLVNRAHERARTIADRHYNRQSVGSKQFVPPGRCVVLLTPAPDRALWVTSWPFAEYVKHAWAGAWVNSLFRREACSGLASDLIREAISVTRGIFGEPPSIGMVTFVDPGFVPPTKMRTHRCATSCGESSVFGYIYDRAGFAHVGYTKRGLWAWQIRPEAMPAAASALVEQAILRFESDG